ncbi:MAG: methyltransferase domain-containing protein [Acidimicrobiales bacterium]
MSEITCRSCRAPLLRSVLDLGDMPLANAYPATREQCEAELVYPLGVRICEACWLLQLAEEVPPELLFSEYAYFSSISETWLAHAASYAKMAIERWHLDDNSLVVEVASNDGYLLRHFVERGVPVLGIDPAKNVVDEAIRAGVATEVGFFGLVMAQELAARGISADLLVANNVLAHVASANDFVGGLARVLAPEGVLTVEFPELSMMLAQAQFDQIYHEHVFYFSLLSCELLLSRGRLRVFDVSHLGTHGGSLRIFACHQSASHDETASVQQKRRREEELGLGAPAAYEAFASVAQERARSIRSFLEDCVASGRTVAAYGAAAKGNTLLNYCGASTREIAYVVDRSPHKQGHLLPGSHIPVLPPEHLISDRPDYVLVLAWNLLDEVMASFPEVRSWGGRFVTTVPKLTVVL